MCREPMIKICLCLALMPLAPDTAGWKAGAAKVSITPRGSLWMAGFGDRKKPSEGVGLELFARALALEDTAGRSAVIVSTDMLGFPAAVSRIVSERVRTSYGITRDRLLLNSSHTHCGPVVDHMLEGAYDLTPNQWADIEAYTRELEDRVVEVVGEALRNLAPARLSFGQTNASFGVNRRLDAGRKWGPNYAGTADHDVPILRVEGEHGEVRALVFGFGCHPSTLPPSYTKFHGDYAGVTEKCLEDRHAGAVALFVMGAGGDVKPFPCDTLALAEKYGELLAATVEHQLEGTMTPIRGPLTSVFETVPLAFGTPPTRKEFERRLKAGSPVERRHAARMLALLERDGHLPAEYPEPLQAWQFGRDLTLVAMGGEVLSDYALRLKREFDGRRLWVTGYSNDVFAYIPSLRVLKEGGYEGADAMLYYMQPGPWAPPVEETIVTKVHELIERVRIQ
jgi:neutral ceramidase